VGRRLIDATPLVGDFALGAPGVLKQMLKCELLREMPQLGLPASKIGPAEPLA
jgi:hypothetical protein